MDTSRFPEIFLKKMRVYRDRKKAPVKWLRAGEVSVPVDPGPVPVKCRRAGRLIAELRITAFGPSLKLSNPN